MPRKTYKTLFLEITLFVCLFALVGHLSVNFWERYFIQNELTKMKSSLYNLKDTIAHIGTVYNELHKELQGLADIAEKKTDIESFPQNKFDAIQTTEVQTVAQKLLKNFQVQAMIGPIVKDSAEFKNKRIDTMNEDSFTDVRNKKIQTAANKNTQMGMNSTTPIDIVTFRKEVGVNVYTENDKNKYTKTAAVIKKYTPKTVATDTGEESIAFTAYRYQEARRNKRRLDGNINRCDDDDCSTENSEYDFSKF